MTVDANASTVESMRGHSPPGNGESPCDTGCGSCISCSIAMRNVSAISWWTRATRPQPIEYTCSYRIYNIKRTCSETPAKHTVNCDFRMGNFQRIVAFRVQPHVVSTAEACQLLLDKRDRVRQMHARQCQSLKGIYNNKKYYQKQQYIHVELASMLVRKSAAISSVSIQYCTYHTQSCNQLAQLAQAIILRQLRDTAFKNSRSRQDEHGCHVSEEPVAGNV